MQRLNLAELDRQLINCTTGARTTNKENSKSSPISYGQLYDIARSIIAIDFDLSNKSSSEDFQDREEFEKTLTKILQLCQTIIDFLLADIKRLEMERSELPANRNNLIQENRKLRKLLQLQQKAIIYRRMDVVASTTAPISNRQQEEEDGSLENLDQLSSDSKSIISNNNFISSSKLQCMYCSKIFQDPAAYTKHLQLRHLTSITNSTSIDQSFSFNSSLFTNLNLIQRLFQQNLATQQTKLAENSNIAQENVHSLQIEIKALQEKLDQTERQLQKEKEARTNFENDLKVTFQEQVMSMKMQLEEKIAQIKILQERVTDSVNSIPKKTELKEERRKMITNKIEEHDSKSQDQTKDDSSSKPTRRKNQPNLASFEETNKSLIDSQQEFDLKLESTATKLKAQKEEHRLEIQPNLSIRSSKSLDDIGKAEENEPEVPTKDDHLKQSLRMELISQLTFKRQQKKQKRQDVKDENSEAKALISEKEIALPKQKKLERSNAVQFEPEPEEEPNQQPETKPITECENQTKAEIYESIEARLKSYIDTNQFGGKEKMFDRAMDQIQQDRNLLIQQSRHDYDFVNIEESIRDMIDSKVKSKINGENTDSEPVNLEPVIQENKPIRNQITNSNSNSSVPQEEKSPNGKSTKNKSSSSKLKSILKDRTTIREPAVKRNITFNNEIIEYEISPLASEDESELVQLIDGNGDNFSNRIFSIQDDHHQTLQPMNGEKIFIDHDLSPSSSTTSSTTASDDETEQNRNNKELDKNITVDVHQPPVIESIPVPAKRKTVSNQNTESSTSNTDAEHKSSRVSELTELIERKLQNPGPMMPNGGGPKKLPPLGSIDSMMMSMRSRPQPSAPPLEDHQRKKEENSHTSRHSLDAYDLYEF